MAALMMLATLFGEKGDDDKTGDLVKGLIALGQSQSMLSVIESSTSMMVSQQSASSAYQSQSSSVVGASSSVNMIG